MTASARAPNPHCHPHPGAVTPARALRWFAFGWRLFLKNPLVWLAQAVVLLAILALAAVLPFINAIVAPLAFPMLIAGMVDSADRLDRGETIYVFHLFEGVRRHAGNLLVVGGFYLLGALLDGWLAHAVGVETYGSALLFTALWSMLILALWFAPALVMLQGVAPLEAMQLSVRACFANLPALIVFAVALCILVWVALLPYGLGMLVLVPVIAGTALASWRDVFSAPPVPTPTTE